MLYKERQVGITRLSLPLFPATLGNTPPNWGDGGEFDENRPNLDIVFIPVSYHCLYSVQFSCSIVSNSLWPHGLQHARLPCSSPSPRACLNSCPSSWWCHPTISFSVVSFSSCPLSDPAFGVFSSESALCIRCPKYWSFSFSISPCNEHSGLISFRMDWLDLLAVQLTLKSLLQHTSKASILQHSAFFIVQLSHHYMTTGKTIALTRRTFVDKVMSLLFNMLSRFVIAFLRCTHHLQ